MYKVSQCMQLRGYEPRTHLCSKLPALENSLEGLSPPPHCLYAAWIIHQQEQTDPSNILAVAAEAVDMTQGWHHKVS